MLNPNHLHIDIQGAPGAGKSTLLRRIADHAPALGIEIVSVADGEQQMGQPARLVVRFDHTNPWDEVPLDAKEA